LGSKLDEKILCVEKLGYFLGLESNKSLFSPKTTDQEILDFYSKKTSFGREHNLQRLVPIWLERGIAEKNPNYLQPIPYIVVMSYNDENDEILTYIRSKKGGEKRLHDKVSIGIGGHINDFDVRSKFGGFFPIILDCLYREIREETGVSLYEHPHLLSQEGWFYSPVKEVDRVHLCLLHVLRIQKNLINLNYFDPETGKRAEWLPKEKISVLENLETWSIEALKYI
jgi:predicted NUDIX family phosphoesterase